MFKKIIQFLKGVLEKMFKGTDIAQKFNINSVMSDTMASKIELWKNLYKGIAPWASDTVKVSNTPSQVANEFARLTTLEMKSEVTGSARADYINGTYQNFIAGIGDKLEKGNAVGGVYFKPFVSEGKIHINAIEQGDFVPIAFDGDGNLTSVIFIDTFTAGEENYTRLELNHYEAGVLTITNKAYKSKDKKTIGDEVPLTSVDRWADIEATTSIQNLDRLLGGFYKVPKANNIDNESPLGISVYARAIQEFENLDKQKSRLEWEYESAERKIYVDKLALKDPTGKAKTEDRLIKSLDVNNEAFFNDYSPIIRDDSLLKGINAYKREVEFACDLAYGTISDPMYIEKTATEIRGSKQKSYAVVSKMQRALEKALNDLIYSIDVLCTLYKLAPAGAYEASYKWDDSLIVDAETERNQDIRDMSIGIMRKEEYRAKWYGESEQEAMKNLPQIDDLE